ncbi:MAG: ROK family protein [Longibaculum sp.]
MNYLGIDIGGTFIKYAIVDEDYRILKKWKKESIAFFDKDDFYDYLCQDLDMSDIKAIGISAPGIIDKESNVLSKAADTVKIMFQTQINQEVSKRLGKPTFAMNDAKAAGLCELTLGNSRGSQISTYFIIGTGVGGCVYHRLEAFHGVNNTAGELSFLPFTLKDQKIVSLSHYASIPALISIYNQKTNNTLLQYGTEVCDLYLKGDSIAKDAIDEWCQNIIFALNTLVICYNPEVICIGGGISEEDWFIEKIQKMFQDSLPKRIGHLITTRIERCAYHNDANILGAICYVKNQLKKYNNVKIVFKQSN